MNTIQVFAMTLLISTSSLAIASNSRMEITGNLTPEQQATLQLMAAKMAVETTDTPINATDVKEWVEVGSAIGEGMAAAAGKLGVEVNQFATSNVGKFTMIIIAYHYLGQDAVRVTFGMLLLLFGIPIWIWLYIKNATRVVSSQTTIDGNTTTQYTDAGDGIRFTYTIVLAFIFLTAILAITTI